MNQFKLDKAKSAIDRIFSDTSITHRETLAQLEELSEYLAERITAIEENIKILKNLIH